MSFDQTQRRRSRESHPIEPQVEIIGGEESEFDRVRRPRPRPTRKRMAVLGGLLLVGAITIWFMYFRNGPQAAQGALSVSDGGSQIKQFLDSGNINMMKQTLKETEKIVKQFRAYPGKTQIPLESLRTNPFRELEPKADSPVAIADKDAERAEELHKQAIAAVAELHLQSIVRGNKVRACMVNNTLYREGQQIGVLTIEQVTPAIPSSCPAANIASK